MQSPSRAWASQAIEELKDALREHMAVLFEVTEAVALLDMLSGFANLVMMSDQCVVCSPCVVVGRSQRTGGTGGGRRGAGGRHSVVSLYPGRRVLTHAIGASRERIWGRGGVIRSRPLARPLPARRRRCCRFRYVRPTFTISGVLALKQARHPIIERQAERTFVPNDLAMQPMQNLWVITGENGAGRDRNALCINV